MTGLKGGITHPHGTLYSTNTHNFTPRIGVAWNFKPQFCIPRVLRDVHPGPGDRDLPRTNTIAQAVVQQPSGNPFPAFYLSQGPGPVNYNVTSNGTAQFVGTNYSSRNTSFIDSHLKNPYSMTWSGGFQWEFRQNYLAGDHVSGIGGGPSDGDRQYQYAALVDLQFHGYDAAQRGFCQLPGLICRIPSLAASLTPPIPGTAPIIR